jgi:hypothetical protein
MMMMTSGATDFGALQSFIIGREIYLNDLAERAQMGIPLWSRRREIRDPQEAERIIEQQEKRIGLIAADIGLFSREEDDRDDTVDPDKPVRGGDR